MGKKIWGIMVQLSKHTSHWHYDYLPFDDKMWDFILKGAVDAGLNTVIFSVSDGIQYASHPEIAMPGAWSRERVHQEVQRCRDLGIALIPKLNFSASHSPWLKDYARMISSPAYYQLAKDLIEEVYELFEQPEFIHLGMDEEDFDHQNGRDFVCFRQGELLWHDLNYLMDCVCATGARPWIWSCPLFSYPEEYKKHIDAKKAVLSPWYYNAFRKEHWTPVESRADYVAYYNEGKYKEMGIKWVEEDPFLVNFRNVALPLLQEGYEYVPCASVFNRCEYNHADLMEYFKENAPDDQILGFMSAPWMAGLWKEQNVQYYEESFRYMKEARAAFYPD